MRTGRGTITLIAVTKFWWFVGTDQIGQTKYY